MLRTLVKRSFRRFGYDLIRYKSVNHPLARRMALIDHYGINLVIDVGANAGQFGMHMRELGYRQRIASFEPVSSTYQDLVRAASHDSQWETDCIALGDFDGESEINLTRNSFSSSILDMLPAIESSAPELANIGKERIVVRTLDSVIDKYRRSHDRIYLKIDTQGFEKNVIVGAEQSLRDVIGVQMEVSLVPLYKGETLLSEMVGFMTGKGYTLMSLEPGYGKPDTGQLLQCDCVFFRN
jgi:FkbM family methyltransferase